jgi:hypothetical protein
MLLRCLWWAWVGKLGAVRPDRGVLPPAGGAAR